MPITHYNPQILVEPRVAMHDEPVQIRLTGFPPSHRVSLKIQMYDGWGQKWQSQADFQTDEQGRVDLQDQAPLSGSYAGKDGMGLFWSMTLIPDQKVEPATTNEPLPPTQLTLVAEVEGQSPVQTSIQRLQLGPNTTRRPVNERGLVGTLFQPDDAGSYPGIILLGGSEGGLHERDAALLAARGFAVLALAYFGMKGVPPALVNIPLEYFETAIDFLAEQKGVQSEKLGIIGGSRGGEAALLIGSVFPQIKAVVSYLGSGLITQGIGAGRNFLEMVGGHVPSWTYQGQALPYLPTYATRELEEQVKANRLVELRLAFLPGMQDEVAVAAATIAVEKINGPVLLISAEDDRMWPSEALSQIAAQRLAQHKHPYFYQHLKYPQTGHGIIPPPYGPTTEIVSPGPGVLFNTGGTPEVNAFARADAWKQATAFFEQHLK